MTRKRRGMIRRGRREERSKRGRPRKGDGQTLEDTEDSHENKYQLQSNEKGHLIKFQN